MKLYIQLSMTLLWLGVLIPNVTRGQSPGSEEILQDFFSIASGSTSSSASESLFIGPGTYEIDGTWEIYSKNVWISPDAVIAGPGIIKFFNPLDVGGTASSNFIDGNNNVFADVNIELRNSLGLHITDRTTASLPGRSHHWYFTGNGCQPPGCGQCYHSGTKDNDRFVFNESGRTSFNARPVAEMSKPLTLRIANVGDVGSTTAGVITVFMSVGSNFTAALDGSPAWTLTDDGGGEYTLTSSLPVRAHRQQPRLIFP